MPNKQDITQAIINLWPGPDVPDLDQALRQWYYNLRTRGGLRLTDRGVQCLQAAGLQHWSVPVDWRRMPRRVLLDLDRRLSWPYYIDVRGRRLIMFGASEALWANLYGDIQQCLTRLQPRAQATA